jgi:hypothetical protein
MPVSHVLAENPSQPAVMAPALGRLHRFLAEREEAGRSEDFASLEREIREIVRGVECEILTSELAKLDVNVEELEIDGHRVRQVGRYEQEYFTAAGKVRVERSLYRPRGGSRTQCPLELRAGIMAGAWTPLAAKQACWVTANLTPGEGAELFELMGGMSPSSSSLDRLPKKIGGRWEADREDFEQLVREDEHVPDDAVTMAVSLDGVMVPMNDLEVEGERSDRRGRRGQHPGTYREASCASVSFYASDGERLRTLRSARMPESKKRTLKAWITEEAGRALAEQPELTLVKVADGALDNWKFLSEELPGGVEVIDFYHATEHLRAALEQAHGEGSKKARQKYEKLRLKLRDEPNGVESVIRSLRRLSKRNPRKLKLVRELDYFRNNRHRMSYAALLEQDLPIGSGVVEATCKTLVTQRLKRSGMRWSHEGGQAILLLRSLVQSERFDRGWNLLLSTYKREVRVPEGVLEFPTRKTSRGVSA